MDALKQKLLAEWVRKGSAMYPHTYAKTQDLTEAIALGCAWIEGLRTTRPDWFAAMQSTFDAPGPSFFLLWSARWAECGFPIVSVGDELADVFLRADFQPDLLETLRPRWAAFLVELPGAAIRMHGTPESPVASYMAVFHDREVVVAMLRSTETREIVGIAGPTLDAYLNGISVPATDAGATSSPALSLVPAAGGTRDATLAAWKLMIGIELEVREARNFALAAADAPLDKGMTYRPRVLRVRLTRRIH